MQKNFCGYRVRPFHRLFLENLYICSRINVNRMKEWKKKNRNKIKANKCPDNIFHLHGFSVMVFVRNVHIQKLNANIFLCCNEDLNCNKCTRIPFELIYRKSDTITEFEGKA